MLPILCCLYRINRISYYYICLRPCGRIVCFQSPYHILELCNTRFRVCIRICLVVCKCRLEVISGNVSKQVWPICIPLARNGFLLRHYSKCFFPQARKWLMMVTHCQGTCMPVHNPTHNNSKVRCML